MKKKKVVICSLILFLFILLGLIGYSLPISMGGKPVQIYENLDSNALLSVEEICADREQLIELVESVHPCFVDGSNITEYEKAKNAFILATESEMTVREFRYEVGKYLAVFKDGHTRLWWSDEKTFEIWHKYTDNHMFYYRYEDGEVVPTGSYITAVNDIPVERIFEVIEQSSSAENAYSKAVNYDDYFTSESILRLAGVDISGDSVEVTLNDGTVEKCSYFVKRDTFGNSSKTGNRWSWDGDIFIFTFESCTRDEGFTDAVNELKKAIKNGCTKVIIDVRDNGGGNSNTCTELLEAMGMKVPKYGMLIRYSKEAKKQTGYIRSSGTYVSGAKLNGKQNPNIDLVVLYNRNTFSSANMMCVYVKDGELGTLIGEPCSNSPSHYGQPIKFSLENSHLYGSISHKAFTRPNGDWEEKELLPDIETADNDSYQTAVDYLMSR